jgi:sporulation protein YlmC with PRC-barrel domain
MRRGKGEQEAVDPNEPVGYYGLQVGTPVVGTDGRSLGTVQRVVIHERERLLDGIVVQAEDGRRFVDAPEVVSMTRSRVEVEYDEAGFLALPIAGGVTATLDQGIRRLRRRR